VVADPVVVNLAGIVARYLRINFTGAPTNPAGQTVIQLSACAVYALQGTATQHLDFDVQDGTSFARHVASDMTSNRIDFSKGLLNKQLDNIPDGSTYGRPILSRLNGGKPLIDFSEAIHLNKNLDNMPNGTRAAWDSTTQKTAAVDASGNLLIKNTFGISGSTAGPTTSSTTYTVIPEITTTITTKGNKVLIVFTGTFTNNGSSGVTGVSNYLAVFRDGVQVTPDFLISNFSATFNNHFSFPITYIDAPSAASHTYDIRWKVGSATGVEVLGCILTSRTLQIVELG